MYGTWLRAVIATALLTGFPAPGLANPPASILRLLDEPGQIVRDGHAGDLRSRLVEMHLALGEMHTLFFRGVTIQAGEHAVFSVTSEAGAALRWIEGPPPDSEQKFLFAVEVNGVEVSPAPGSVYRSVSLPAGASEIRFLAPPGGEVRLGEPMMVRRGSLGPPGSRPPDVLLITVDTLRRDDVSIHGGPEPATPGLAALARESVVFDDAIAPSSWTLPSFAGLFTGLHPRALGVSGRDSGIPASIVTLTEGLRDAGYHTHAIAQNVMLAPDAGFARGFDVYDFFASTKDEARSAAEVTDLALDWLEGAPTSPGFLWAHYFDPHARYAPSAQDARRFDPTIEGVEPFDVPPPTNTARIRSLRALPDAARRRLRALYRGEVRAVDREIARLLEAWRAAGRLERSVVIVTSDHGEEFLEHGFAGHGHSVHEELIRVPLILRLPQARGAGRRIGGQVTLLDLAPTLADLVGIAPAPGSSPSLVAGRSLTAVLAGGSLPSRAELAVAGLFPDHLGFCVRGSDRKWMFTGDPREERVVFYDLASDPGEHAPLSDVSAADLSELVRFWTAIEGEAAAPVHLQEKLRALGYVE